MSIISQLKLVKAQEIFESVMFVMRCVFSVVCKLVMQTGCKKASHFYKFIPGEVQFVPHMS